MKINIVDQYFTYIFNIVSIYNTLYCVSTLFLFSTLYIVYQHCIKPSKELFLEGWLNYKVDKELIFWGILRDFCRYTYLLGQAFDKPCSSRFVHIGQVVLVVVNASINQDGTNQRICWLICSLFEHCCCEVSLSPVQSYSIL